MSNFKGKTVFITGGSRGIGKAIGLRLAQEGANIVIAAKTTTPHPRLSGTIYTAAEEIEKAGGQALPIKVDIRFEDNILEAVEKTVETFGGIDILVNNASAISLTGTLQTEMKRYDLMHSVNTRGTFLTSKCCLPHLLKAENPHILNLAPPIKNIEEKWFAPHLAYTMAKYGMSMCVLGMAGEFRKKGVAVNALWPQTAIATAAVGNILGGEQMIQCSRKPSIMSDAAYYVLKRDSRTCTGNFFIDEAVLQEEGITDLTHYAVNPDKPLAPDFFV
ncbi:MAG: NAD(P)-dependent oxidoreductase [Bacteroidota bacterium]